MIDTAERLLTTAELAARWGISPGTLRNHRSAGRGIRYVRLLSGAAVRYKLSDVLEAERKGTVGAA